MVDKVLEALETASCETWDSIFNAFSGVHPRADSGNRTMFALRLPHVDFARSGLGYHECEALMSFTSFILRLLNNRSSRAYKASEAAAIRAQGREMQSHHGDVMKVSDGKRVVSVYTALDEDLYSVDGTDTVFLPQEFAPSLGPYCHSARRGDLFVFCMDSVHAGGCIPLSKPESWWRRTLLLGIATIPVRCSYTVGAGIRFGGLEDGRNVDGRAPDTISGFRKKATKGCFRCGVPRLCVTYEGELCLACWQVCVGSMASAAASAPRTPGFQSGSLVCFPF